MAPTRGERGGKEGSWVKKGGYDKAPVGDGGSGGDDGQDKPSRRPRQPREPRPRREPREGGRDEATGVDDSAPPQGEGGRGGKGQRGRGRGRGGRRGAQDQHQQDQHGEDEESEQSGSALLNMLKANTPKIIRYSKGELLFIARLPQSNIKPPDLSELIDKENKESQLLVKIASSRSPFAEDDGAEQAARKERRERRAERRQQERGAGGSDDGDAATDEQRQRRKEEKRNGAAPESPGARAVPADGGQAPRPDAIAKPETKHHSGASTATPKSQAPFAEEGDVDVKASRAFDKWFDQKKTDQGSGALHGAPAAAAAPAAPTAGAPASGAAPSFAAALAAAGHSGGSPPLSQGYPSSLLQQQAAQTQAQVQAQAQAQAHAMQVQAAAYMQAMSSMHAASAQAQAAAAGRGGQGAGGAYPGLPWGYNPYMFPYGGNPYGSYPDFASNPQAAAQAKLAAAQAAAAGYGYNPNLAAAMAGGGGAGAGHQAVGTKKGRAPVAAQPAQAAAFAGGAMPQKSPKIAAADAPFAAKAPEHKEPAASGMAGGEGKEGGDEDDAGCSQS